MKFNINKTELQNALSVVLKGVSNRSTLPVLSGILITANDSNVIFQSTDLDMSIKYSALALVEEPGKTVVPGKLFTDIIKSLPEAAVRISSDEDTNSIHISCDSSSFSIKTLSADDFPGFPEIISTQKISLGFEVFSSMIKKVSKVVSKDDTRAILTGVLLETEDTTLRMVATDSYRLALTEKSLESLNSDSEANFSVVIGGSFLSDVANLNLNNEEVTLGFSDNQIIIEVGDITFINRRIEGNYPNYRQLLPDGYTTRAQVSNEELFSAVKRASLLSTSSAPLKFTISPEPVNLLTITVNSNDVGSVQENIECMATGEEVEIAFNSNYVVDGLNNLKEEKIFFDVQTSLKPGIFHTLEPNDYLYLIMPVRI